jgi:hypothetical protein
MIYACTATGSVTLNTGANEGLMIYAGGIAGYSGTATAGSGASGCLIVKSRWTSGAVSAAGGYPYAGGIVGYNYTGARIAECSSTGTAVTATGDNLPYAGGVAGYNSGYVKDTAIVSVIENCYSTAAVTATSAMSTTSGAALAGGIAGSNAKGALISACYATGAVTAKVKGDSGANTGGSLGPLAAASAGGIAGAQYYAESNIFPVITNCAALNGSLTGEDSASGAVWNIYRIAGAGAAGYDVGIWRNNIANSGMTLTTGAATRTPTGDDKTPNGKDGADTTTTPGQSAFTALGWDFATVWKMSGGYPVLQWQ